MVTKAFIFQHGDDIMCNKSGKSSISSMSDTIHEEIWVLKKFGMTVEKNFTKFEEEKFYSLW